MSRTPFAKKCEILADIWTNLKDKEDLGKTWKVLFKGKGWKGLVRANDLGFPLAFLVYNGYVTISKRDLSRGLVEDSFTFVTGEGLSELSKGLVETTWDDVCELLNVDKDALYYSTIDLFRASELYKDLDWDAIDAVDEYDE